MAKDFSDVPPPLLLKIQIFMPVDSRARACCVCPAWRDALASPALWTRLDLSVTSGVMCSLAGVHAEGGALRAASRRARGDTLNPGPGLETLEVTGHRSLGLRLLRQLVSDNADTLRELRTITPEMLQSEEYTERYDPEDFVDLLERLSARPALQALGFDVSCDYDLARRLLLNEPPYEKLRLRQLHIFFDDAEPFPDALAADLVAHPSLQEFVLQSTEQISSEQLVPLLGAALTLRLSVFSCYGCCPTAAVAPALARLLSSSVLKDLSLSTEWGHNRTEAMLDEPAAVLLADVLRGNSTLRNLRLCNVGFWDDAQAGVVLLSALTGHASLHVLDLGYNCVPPAAAATIGAALGALVAANAPAFETLVLHSCEMGDAGFGPLLDALLCNTHLRTLHMHGTVISRIFAEQQMLPAVTANTSLLEFLAEPRHDYDETVPNEPFAAIDEAMRVVGDRERARAAAEHHEHEQQLAWRARMAAAGRPRGAVEAAASGGSA